MRTLTSGLLRQAMLGAILFPMAALTVSAEQIVRIPKSSPTPVPVLDAVELPAGTTTLILSGQTPAPLDPAKTLGLDDYGDMKTQAASVFGKIKKILEKQGYSLQDVVKLTVLLVADPRSGGAADFAAMNEVYATFFGTRENPSFPARSSMQVAGLGKPGYRIEVEAIAAKAGAK